jgi:hypothetical protein
MMMDMRILITGDRHWRCNDLAKQIVNRLIARYGPDLGLPVANGPKTTLRPTCPEIQRFDDGWGR